MSKIIVGIALVYCQQIVSIIFNKKDYTQKNKINYIRNTMMYITLQHLYNRLEIINLSS